MKLTEAKLKKMILEALKNSSLRSFGIPTPDEKLRSQIGDANFDKIQSLASNPDHADQALMLKQGLDDTYPNELKQENINDILGPLGFTEYKPGEFGSSSLVYKVFEAGGLRLVPYGPSRYEVRLSYGYGKYNTRSFEEYRENPYAIAYNLEIQKLTPGGAPTFRIEEEILLSKREQIRMPKLFTIDMTDQQDREKAESLIVLKEKAAILKALEELT